MCQFSSVTRGTFLGRRPLVPPAQGIALGHHTPTPSVSRPNGPTDSAGRQLACPAAKDYDHRLHDPVLGVKGEPLARWADRVCIATWFPRALPWAWRPPPFGAEMECKAEQNRNVTITSTRRILRRPGWSRRGQSGSSAGKTGNDPIVLRKHGGRRRMNKIGLTF